MPSSTLLNYYQQQHCSRQWRDVLGALAEEFNEALPAEDLRRLMQRIGRRFAIARALPACATLAELDRAINAQWEAVDWGFAVFIEHADRLEVRHYGAPLEAGFGQHSGWAGGFLEGAYQAWFVQSGMIEGLLFSQDASGEALAHPQPVVLQLART